MFQTLERLLQFYGSSSKAVVWAHNSHVGDAHATEMTLRGEHNLGQLCRAGFLKGVHVIGFGTDRGTVAAGSAWDGPMEIKSVRPALAQSYERLFHTISEDENHARFILNVSETASPELRKGLMKPRLERAIGVIYRPESEVASHYFQAVLPQQFDDYVWFDETTAVTPLQTEELEGAPETYPFGL